MAHIIHADLDAFYATVEQLDNPELRGKPVLVGGRPESRGVVATASYEARPFGVHSAMPMRTAVRLCPQGIIVRPRFNRYREMSRLVMDVFRDFTEIVEPLSLDEAYLDISGRWPLGVALELKRRVKEETGLTVSVGVSASKYVSKIASDLQKPDGLVVVPSGDETGFLAPLAVGKLWGIGPKTAERLNAEGVETIGDLASKPTDWFARVFGQRAESVRLRAAGQDNEPVHTERVTKSVSSETTFPDDIGDTEELHRVLDELASGVSGSLEGKGLQGRTVTVKMRLADFTTFSRQSTLPRPSNDVDPIRELAWRLLSAELTAGRTFRLLGVGVSNFSDGEEERQLPLTLEGDFSAVRREWWLPETTPLP
ncbi:DNA polymerase IV [Geodia barretti]|uniref:DNA polymerase kappa n=1 Tax=Geodia barretti TaxID=519541 RepID=A0AA35WIE7_GEOBA|nr:DNA polymerase IV [Geodia barretti]